MREKGGKKRRRFPILPPSNKWKKKEKKEGKETGICFFRFFFPVHKRGKRREGRSFTSTSLLSGGQGAEKGKEDIHTRRDPFLFGFFQHLSDKGKKGKEKSKCHPFYTRQAEEGKGGGDLRLLLQSHSSAGGEGKRKRRPNLFR